MRKGQGSAYDKWNISVVIRSLWKPSSNCDIGHMTTGNLVPYTKHKMLPFKKYLMIGSSLTHVWIYILEED
jgi:hypothetical protein